MAETTSTYGTSGLRHIAGTHPRVGVRTASRRRSRSNPAGLVWVVLLAAIVTGVGALPTAEDRVPSGQTATISVRVSSDDTLWSIASSHRLPGVSTARMVELISESNGLPQSGIRAGVVLRVPVETGAPTAYALAEGSLPSE